MSKITVIVPVYKVEPYLRRCIDSILSQTFTDFDLILVDDGSPDQCGAICDEYKMLDPRVFVIHHQENLGLSAARNSGIDWTFENSDSQWISFVDSDDWVHPLYLAALYEAAQGYGIAVCYRSKTQGEELPEIASYSVEYLKPEDYYLKYMGNSTVAWAKMYSKNLFRDIRYPVGKLHEDEFVTYRLLFKSEIIPFIPQQLYAHYLNPEGIMRRTWNPHRLDALEAYEEQLHYFASKGYHVLAEKIFRMLININRKNQKILSSYEEISRTHQYRLTMQLRRQLQRILCRYRKNKWISIWNRGEDLWIYSDTFVSIHALHMLWRKIKSLRHSWISK